MQVLSIVKRWWWVLVVAAVFILLVIGIWQTQRKVKKLDQQLDATGCSGAPSFHSKYDRYGISS